MIPGRPDLCRGFCFFYGFFGLATNTDRVIYGANMRFVGLSCALWGLSCVTYNSAIYVKLFIMKALSLSSEVQYIEAHTTAYGQDMAKQRCELSDTYGFVRVVGIHSQLLYS